MRRDFFGRLFASSIRLDSGALVLPEPLEPVGRQRRVAHRRDNGAVAK